MRLHWFLPMGSDRSNLKRILSILGPTWQSCPIRRVIQSLCLISFILMFLYLCWPYGSSHYAESFAAKEIVEAKLFLIMDPLLSISTAIAGRMWVPSLSCAIAVLASCLILPRGFCAYICPLGTLLDLFDWLIGKRVTRSRPRIDGRLANIRYYILGAVLVAAALGVMLSGFVSAIAVLTRAMLFVVGAVQMGLVKGWYLVPPMNAGHWISITMFALLIALSLLERRFWCKYLCPTGAVFSVANVFRLTERKVRSHCVECAKCEEMCSFAAINRDYTTKQLNCSFCQSCAGICPVGAIEFAGRWDRGRCKVEHAEGNSHLLARRNLLTGIGGVALGAGVPVATCKVTGDDSVLIRPPGSIPERAFLRVCVRCGQCIKVCPNNVLQPLGLEHGFDALWTPEVTPNWSGCAPSCNTCGQVCPTGAIRALVLPEKRVARIGLAVVDKGTCLPYVKGEPCQLCVDECHATGYDAIEFVRVGGEIAKNGEPVEGSGALAPAVLKENCVGCGLCQMRCRAINVKEKHLLKEAAIQVVAGPGKEDRILHGSYVELRDQRARHQKASENSPQDTGSNYLPGFLR
jgi:polyferredoxin